MQFTGLGKAQSKNWLFLGSLHTRGQAKLNLSGTPKILLINSIKVQHPYQKVHVMYKDECMGIQHRAGGPGTATQCSQSPEPFVSGIVALPTSYFLFGITKHLIEAARGINC